MKSLRKPKLEKDNRSDILQILTQEFMLHTYESEKWLLECDQFTCDLNKCWVNET